MPDWNLKSTWDAQYSNAIRKRIGLRGYHRRAPAHYQWCEHKHWMEAVLAKQLAQPGWAQVSSVALIGGSFGWGREYLASQGIETFSVDTSDWVVNNWNVSEEAELRAYMDADPVLVADGYGPGNNFFDVADCFIDTSTGLPISGQAVWDRVLHPSGGRAFVAPSDEDLSTQQSANAVKNRFSGSLDAIVTEQLLTALDTELEIDTICDGMERLKPNPACTRLHIINPEPDSPLGLGDLAAWKAWLTTNGYGQHFVSDLQGNWL